MNKFRLPTAHYIMLSNSSALLLGMLPRFGTIARQVFWHCCRRTPMLGLAWQPMAYTKE